tara:strand:- start:99 stop:272 length:174 start_codon:yes stop_codon:yes gene_type:complete
MSKKKKAKRINTQKFQKVVEEQHSEKNNTLILSGLILAMISIGLLIFVLSEKLFHLS